MSEAQELRPLDFIGPSREDLKAFPEKVRRDIGHALAEVQRGRKPAIAKPLKGFAGAVLELIERFDGGAYRAVYTVEFREVIYVLHCFQKKSKSGIKTPRQDLALIERRLKAAFEDYQTRYGRGGQ